MPHRIAGPEFARLASLYCYGVLDTGPEPAYDQLLKALSTALDVPVARLVFADAHRFWAKSSLGMAEAEHPRGRGFAEQVLARGERLIIAEGDADEVVSGSIPLQSFAGVGITGPDHETLGALYVADQRARDFTDAATSLEAAGAAVVALLEQRRRALEDGATGALKREPFVEAVGRMLDICRSGRQWVSLVTLDIGPFRSALEHKSRGLGSLAVRHMTHLGRSQVRRRDCFGRLDEDLFAILLSDTGEAGARILAQRLSRHLEQGWIDAGFDFATPSVGIATVNAAGGRETATSLIERAIAACPPRDAALDAARVA